MFQSRIFSNCQGYSVRILTSGCTMTTSGTLEVFKSYLFRCDKWNEFWHINWADAGDSLLRMYTLEDTSSHRIWDIMGPGSREKPRLMKKQEPPSNSLWPWPHHSMHRQTYPQIEIVSGTSPFGAWCLNRQQGNPERHARGAPSKTSEAAVTIWTRNTWAWR